MGSDKRVDKGTVSRRRFVELAAMGIASVTLGSSAGCRPTDTLTNVIYADWAKEIDYDNPMKSLKNAPNKKQTTSLPKIYDTEKEEVEEEVEEAVFDEESKNSEGDAPKTEKDTNSDSDADNTEGEAEDPTDGDSNKERAGTKEAQVGGNEVGKDASKDATSEPEAFGSIIAFGEIANIVCLLGGKGALWAGDDDFISKGKDIYASGTFGSTRSGYWSSYSSSGKTIGDKKFNKLCNELDALDDEQRPAYVLYDGSVGCPINSEQATILSDEYGITTTYFFLNTEALIKNTMNYVAKILKSDFQYDATQRYKDYWNFHDKLLSQVNGGNLAAVDLGTKGYMSFRDGGTAKSKMNKDQVCWTLLIDGWDKGAKYDYNKIKTSHGLGYSTIGYLWSPVSYYLQCGGVVNNAAARWQAGGNSFNSKNTYHRYAWQMANYFGQTRKYVTGGELTKDNDLISNNSDGDILLRAQSGEFGLGKLAGEGRFPCVVVTTKDAKEAMEADRDSGHGAYSPYYLEADATGNNPNDPFMGLPFKSGDTSKAAAWISYIGRESGDIDERTADSCIPSSKYANTTKAYDVLVNPHGYYSSWTKGSVESFLECAWAYESITHKYIDGTNSLSTAYGNSAASIVQSFYETFYGRSLSSSVASKILSGGYAA